MWFCITLSLIYKNRINSGVFLIYGKDLILFQHTQKMINVALITTALFLHYQFVAKYLNVFFTLMPRKSHINRDSVLMTLAYSNYCQLYIAFMQILIITHRLKFEEIFWISQKRSRKYGMKVYYTSLNLLVFQEIFLTYFAVSLMIYMKE